MKKKIILIVTIVIVLAALLAGLYFWKGRELLSGGSGAASSGAEPAPDGSEVYASLVSSIMGLNASQLGLNQRFSGVVEPQKTTNIQLETGRTTSEIFVAVDDAVKAGDPLFQYDTDELMMTVEKDKLEQEKIENNIVTQQQQLEELQKQAKNAWGDTLLQYTIQIQEAEVNLKQTEYELDVKKMEIEKNQKAIDQSIVVSPMDGIIRQINEGGGSQTPDMYGNTDNTFMTIIADGQFRIKGLINEQNVYQIAVGTPVTIRSRVDESVTWTGVIDEIDTSNPESGQNQNYYGGMSDPMLQSSKYPFYVSLDSFDGLMMGQHVYIELGSAAVEPAHTEGVWLFEGYFFYEDDPTIPYVWVVENDKLVKREITIGEMDPETGEYQVTNGLSQEDAIAWPDESLTEGMKAIVME